MRELNVNNSSKKVYLKIKDNLIYILTIISLLLNFLFISILTKRNKDIESSNEIITMVKTFYSPTKLIQKVKILEEDDNIKDNSLTEVHIATVTSNDYLYPSLVSMTSALENCNKEKTLLHYYILMKDNFDKEKIDILKSLKLTFEKNVKLNFYYMGDLFENLEDNNTMSYYKLLIPRLFPDIHRMIYLDPDTLIYSDILDMYNLNFQNYFVLGFPYPYYDLFDKLNIYSVIYVNTGVMLMNLDDLREEDIDAKLLNYTLFNYKNLKYPEQDSINYILYPNVGMLPYKYGISIYGNENLLKENLIDKIRTIPKNAEIFKALKSPSIVHFIESEPKIWYKNAKHIGGSKYSEYIKKFQNDFYHYANKTKYKNEIYNLFMN